MLGGASNNMNKLVDNIDRDKKLAKKDLTIENSKNNCKNTDEKGVSGFHLYLKPKSKVESINEFENLRDFLGLVKTDGSMKNLRKLMTKKDSLLDTFEEMKKKERHHNFL